MNGNPKNRNVAPPKQINKIAAPIQVTPTQQVNQTSQVSQPQVNQVNTGISNPQVRQVNTGVMPQPVNTQVATSALAQAAQNQSVRGNNVKKRNNIIKEYDPSTMIFVTILLIILAVLCAFIFYVILPRIEANSQPVEYNDGSTTTISPVSVVPTIKTNSINNGNAVTSAGTYTIDSSFTITTSANGNSIDVNINGNKVTSTKKIFSNIGRVDDVIILILADGDIRSNRVVIYDKNASLVKEIKQFEDVDGMLLLNEPSGYIFSSNNLILLASRVNNNKIILNSEFGSVDGIDLCNFEELQNNKISDSFMVMASYSLSYEGNNEFASPYKINDVTLQEYRDSNNLCR